MVNIWQQTQELLKKHEQEGFVNLRLANDGDAFPVVFMGEPHVRQVVFVETRFLPFDEKLKAQGYRPVLRFAINVALYDTKLVKVYEFGPAVFKDLIRLRDKYSLDGWSFEIQRHGGPRDPKTRYSILPDRQLTQEEQREFRALKPHDLERLYEGGGGKEPPAGAGRTVSDGAVDPNVAAALVAELKALPRELTERFLQRYGIQRVKDLPAAQVDNAHAFIEQMHAELASAQREDAEIDPFA